MPTLTKLHSEEKKTDSLCFSIDISKFSHLIKSERKKKILISKLQFHVDNTIRCHRVKVLNVKNNVISLETENSVYWGSTYLIGRVKKMLDNIFIYVFDYHNENEKYG